MIPARIQRRKIGHLNIAYRIAGSGAPLIMFHGGEGDHQIYDRLQDELGDRVRSISFDQRDCGLTEFAEPEPYTLKDVAHDAVRLMDSLGLASAHVMGNSIGGNLAQLMAYHWPDRVDRLVLGFTWPADERLQDLNPQGMAKRAEYAAMGPAGERLMAEHMSSPAFVAAHPGIIDELRGLTTPMPPEARARRWAAFSGDYAVDPSRIRHKTLLIGGELDNMVPAAVTERLASRIPDARFTVLPGAGHLAARQYPAELAALIAAFLAE